MRGLWHPVSAVFLDEPRVRASPAMLRLILRGEGAVSVVYAGDRMWPAIRSGQTLRVERTQGEPLADGDVLLADENGIPDVARVVRSAASVRVVGDAEPGPARELAADTVFGRVAGIGQRLPWPRGTVRRWIDFREACRRAPENEADPASSVRSKYDDQAAHYATQESGLDDGVSTAVRRRVPSGARILVAGSGAGSECFALEEAGYEVVGVDFARRMVDAAKAAAARRGSRARFEHADLRHHDEPPSSLGAVLFTNEAYGFVPGSAVRIEMMRRLRRALLPEGVLFLSARRVEGAWGRALLTLQWSLCLASGGGWRVGRLAHPLDRRVGCTAPLPHDALHRPAARCGDRTSGFPPGRPGRGARRLSAGTLERNAMNAPARFDFSGFGVELTGRLEGLEPSLGALWGPFTGDLPDTVVLRCRVDVDDALSPDAPYDPKEMIARFEGGSAAFRMGTGRIDVDPSGEAAMALAPTRGARGFYTLANLAAAALAWRLPRHGGLLLHAACCVLDGRAFLLVGAENAGKSTFARLAGGAGARVLSDDVILVHATAAGGDALGSPLRAMEVPGPCRFPIGAILFPEHASDAALGPVTRLAASAKLAANLPFVQESFAANPAPLEVAARLLAAVPSRTLRFAPDASFVPLLRAFEGAAP